MTTTTTVRKKPTPKTAARPRALSLGKFLSKLDACTPGQLWARKYRSVNKAWAECEEPGWMIWFLHEIGAGNDYELTQLYCYLIRDAIAAIAQEPYHVVLYRAINLLEEQAQVLWSRCGTDSPLKEQLGYLYESAVLMYNEVTNPVMGALRVRSSTMRNLSAAHARRLAELEIRRIKEIGTADVRQWAYRRRLNFTWILRNYKFLRSYKKLQDQGRAS